MQATAEMGPPQERESDQECEPSSSVELVEGGTLNAASAPKTPIVGMIWGSSCQDFCHRGLHEGDGGQHMRAHLISICSLLEHKPDFFVFEFSYHGPRNHVSKHIDDFYTSFCGIASPADFGRPTSRHRLYMFGWLDERWSSTGTFEEFEAIFKDNCELGFDDYLLESDAVRNRELRAAAAKKGNVFEEGADVSIEDALTPHQLQRFIQHKALWNGDDHYGTDLDHNVGFATAGRCVPCLESTGTIVSTSQDKIMTAKEHLLVQGEPVFPEVQEFNGPCLFQTMLDKDPPLLTSAELKRLAGQSMHLYIVSAFILYGLSTMTAKDC